jgi:hypothetical protein
MRRLLSRFALAWLVLLPSCDALTSGSILRERQPAIISYHADTVAFTVPDTVDVGENFLVTVRSYGDGCVSQGDTQSFYTNSQFADVVPFDVFVVQAAGNHVCTDILQIFPHVTVLSFNVSGTATVRVRGRTIPGDSVILRERAVYVR